MKRSESTIQNKDSIVSDCCNWGNISSCRSLLFGFSTCWLMLFHSTGIDFSRAAWLPKGIAHILNCLKASGNIGVDIFLILSGIGLYFSFSRDSNINAFYCRRAKRILPAVIICSTLWFGIQDITGVKAYLIYVNLGGVFIYGESYFWYFSLSVLLYLIFPYLWNLFNKTGRPLATGITIIIIWIIILIAIKDTSFFFRAEIALTRVPAFILGCAMGEAVLEKRRYGKGLLGVCTFSLAPLLIAYNTSLPIVIKRLLGTVCALLLIIILAILLLKLKKKNPIRILFKTTGIYSMEIYLLYSAVALLSTEVFKVQSATNTAYYIPVAVTTFILAIGLKEVSNKVVQLITDAIHK